MEAAGEGYDLHFKALSSEGVGTVKVNSHPIALQDASDYPPAFVAFDEGGTHKVVFATLERGVSNGRVATHARAVIAKVYSVNNSGTVSIAEEKSITLNTDGKRTGLYSQPLGVARDDRGDVVIVSRAKDKRANPSDQAYVMWRLSGKDFSLIKPRSRTGASSRHLFSRAGANPKTGTPEQLVVWGSRAGKLGLTYVGRYIQREGQQYAMPYKAYYADIPYSARSQDAECSTGCYIGGRAVILSESDAIGFVNHIEIQGVRYTMYVDKRSLSIAAYDGKTRKVFHRVLNFGMQPTSMNVKLLEDGGVGITVVDEFSMVHMYELRLDQLMLGNCGCNVYATTVRASALSIREFIDIASQGLQLVPRINEVGTSTSTVSVVVEGHNEHEELYLDVTEFAYPVRYLQAPSQQPEETPSEGAYEFTTHAEDALGAVSGEVTESDPGAMSASAEHHDAGTQPKVTTDAAEHATQGFTPRAHPVHHVGGEHVVPSGVTKKTWTGSSTESLSVVTPHMSAAHDAVGDVSGANSESSHSHRRGHDQSSAISTTLRHRTTLGQNRGHAQVGSVPIGGGASGSIVTPVGGDHARFARSADSGTVSTGTSAISDAIKWSSVAVGIALLVALVAAVKVFVARYRKVVNFRNRIYRLDCEEGLDLFHESGSRSYYVVGGTSEPVCSTPMERGYTNASEL
ncbi:hypothetical protein ACIS_01072 [Anaplasma centrale str. Israel]|uniref:Uncharacterized protein n=1 Tax=Anaplasma centrale (strain Israel) TaxID=574556 RepID=D1ASU5_ANACI|nr:hypothetical protein ACIS_01072 [Anaplasma centrale str. Israel]